MLTIQGHEFGTDESPFTIRLTIRDEMCDAFSVPEGSK
jgi:hypothetical protein